MCCREWKRVTLAPFFGPFFGSSVGGPAGGFETVPNYDLKMVLPHPCLSSPAAVCVVPQCLVISSLDRREALEIPRPALSTPNPVLALRCI